MSRRLFEDAEARQAAGQSEYSRLYSLPGFQYCILLLSDAERVAWQHWLNRGAGLGGTLTNYSAACEAVSERARQWLNWRTPTDSLLDIALENLTMAGATLYKALLASSAEWHSAAGHITAAVDGLRAAGDMVYLPHGLLTRAWLRYLSGDETGSRADLDEAWEIAERGPMPLFQADIQLTRARLFRDRAALEEARRLLEKHGYHRRDGELADALKAAKGWGPLTADEGSTMMPLERLNGSGVRADAGHSSREIPEPELSIDQLLEQLKRLPAAQFEELVFRYDSQNSVPGRTEAQSVRAIELLKVMRSLENGLATLQAVLRQLRRGGIP